MNIDSKMSWQEKLHNANKYDRLNKLTDKMAEKIIETNKEALSNINSLSKNVYQTCYNLTASDLGIATETKAESNKEVKANANPYQTIAIDRQKDLDQAKRSIGTAILNAIQIGVAPVTAFMLLKPVFEKNLTSSNLMATQQTTILENLAVYTALTDDEKLAHKRDYIWVKVWNSMHDDKVRDAHARADGQEAQLDRPFVVDGEELMYPGDPNGSASNTINCRCWITYEKRAK